jgi:hypothetical protein
MTIGKRDENNLRTWTTRELKARAQSMFCSIYQTECFSSGDIRDYEAIKAELESRGYEFEETRSLNITRG